MMKKLAQWAVAGAVAAAAIAGSAGAAQAAPDHQAVRAGAQSLTSVESFIYTTTLADATSTGNIGVSNGFWTSYRTQSGFGGYSLLVTHTPTTTPKPSYVALLTVPTLAYCSNTGAQGVSEQVWVYYYCQNGIAGYTLFAR